MAVFASARLPIQNEYSGDLHFTAESTARISRIDLESGFELMSKLENVTVVKAANLYFGGQVSSRTVELSDGSTCTLGVMLPGEYTFNTDQPELMEIQAGAAAWSLDTSESAESAAWSAVAAGDSFQVPGNASFRIRVEQTLDYVCSFLAG